MPGHVHRSLSVLSLSLAFMPGYLVVRIGPTKENKLLLAWSVRWFVRWLVGGEGLLLPGTLAEEKEGGKEIKQKRKRLGLVAVVGVDRP